MKILQKLTIRDKRNKSINYKNLMTVDRELQKSSDIIIEKGNGKSGYIS